MQEPLQITFRDIDHSEAVEARIREKIAKLDSRFDRIICCKVVLEQVQKHQHQGKLHNVSIVMTVPGKELAVSRLRAEENLYLAIQAAIDSLTEQLESYRRRISGDVKDHGERLWGKIVRLMENAGYGFIIDSENNEYYFNLTHLIDVKFHQLQVGDEVKFLPAVGNEGWQARRITVTKKQGVVH